MSERNYAASHPVMRVSSKRLARSPFLHRYVTDDAVFGVYAGRLYPLSLGDDPVEGYWRLRREAALFDVPERPLEITGPDAERLLDLVLTRDVTALAPGRAAYALACDHHGGILMDGVLIRFADDRFWYVMADGDFVGWLRAHAEGMDVHIGDPGSWVLQVQGPTSLEILGDACDEGAPDPFPYFGVAEVTIAGHRVVVTRTGWSGELGFEVYTRPGVDPDALWDRLIDVGAHHGMAVQSLESLGIRRIEAGILDNGTDIDPTMTPYAAGLGRFVDLGKHTFVGRDALDAADRRLRLLGVRSESAPVPGDPVRVDGREVGHITAGAYSPHLECGIGYASLRGPADWPGTTVTVGEAAEAAELVTIPFYDPERRIPRGQEI